MCQLLTSPPPPHLLYIFCLFPISPPILHRVKNKTRGNKRGVLCGGGEGEGKGREGIRHYHNDQSISSLQVEQSTLLLYLKSDPALSPLASSNLDSSREGKQNCHVVKCLDGTYFSEGRGMGRTGREGSRPRGEGNRSRVAFSSVHTIGTWTPIINEDIFFFLLSLFSHLARSFFSFLTTFIFLFSWFLLKLAGGLFYICKYLYNTYIQTTHVCMYVGISCPIHTEWDGSIHEIIQLDLSPLPPRK